MSDECACLACRIGRAIQREIALEDGSGKFSPEQVVRGCARVLGDIAAFLENREAGGSESFFYSIAAATAERYVQTREQAASSSTRPH